MQNNTPIKAPQFTSSSQRIFEALIAVKAAQASMLETEEKAGWPGDEPLWSFRREFGRMIDKLEKEDKEISRQTVERSVEASRKSAEKRAQEASRKSTEKRAQ